VDKELLGIHHVTAIASDPQRNIDFYTGVLGLRLVKVTVNFDDPGTYHLYYGDGQGHPGTILTFFPWPDGMPGRIGTGQLTVTSFAVPEKATSYWQKRLKDHSVRFEESHATFDEPALSFTDPDGLQLELVSAADTNPDRAWKDGPVPFEFGIRGFHHVTLSEEGYERTAALLTETMGFKLLHTQGNRFRYSVGAGGTGTIVDVVCNPAGRQGLVSVGTVHHVAWRTPTDEQQQAWREALKTRHYNVTPIIDRIYFHSIYFRETGGVLFEIATDPPGFAIDEPMEKLGETLKLPPWLEPHRSRIEQVLPPIKLPQSLEALKRGGSAS
jgi:glyoxalase family protein